MTVDKALEHADKRLDSDCRTLAAEVRRLRAERDELREAAVAFQSLGVCYRLGKRPTEKLFKQLEKARAALSRTEGGEVGG